MKMNTGNKTLFSRKLFSVMEDIGVTEEMIHYRRHVHLLQEIMESTLTKPSNSRKHIFGSQSEGSTTLGMESDIDGLVYSVKVIACVKLSEWQPAKVNFLVLKTSTSFQQCCSLQFVLPLQESTPIPVCKINLSESANIRFCDQFIFDKQDRVLLSNSYIIGKLTKACEKWTYDVKQHGPAITSMEMQDSVNAIRCPTLPEDCHVLFTRPRPGHWPKEATLTNARKCGVFLVPPGNIGNTVSYDSSGGLGCLSVQLPSNTSTLLTAQWRISTNLTERMLMFDLNQVQMKTYILTKMVRKEFLKPLVGDRLSTFHMKTALLFAVEQLLEKEWREDNIVNCVMYCLNTLRRFLQRRKCPHYTVASVNLFAGKIKVHEFKILIEELNNMMNTNLQYLYRLHMDNVGHRLSNSNAGIRLSSREENRSQIITMLMENVLPKTLTSVLLHCFQTVRDDSVVHAVFETPNEDLQGDFKSFVRTCTRNMKDAAEHIPEYSLELRCAYQHICSILATIEASDCIRDNISITENIINMFEVSLDANHVSNFLKYASMLVCTEQFDKADALLTQTERMVKPEMVQISINRPACKMQLNHDLIRGPCTPTETLLSFANKVIMDVQFLREEVNCVPNHLVCEMYRSVTNLDHRERKMHSGLKQWMDFAVTDSKPFLYYLQYLTSRQLGHHDKKSKAFEKLIEYYKSERDAMRSTAVGNVLKIQGHIESTLNMIGHCLELENQVSRAWNLYRASLQIVPRNNAAYWHLFRLLGQCVYRTCL